MEVVKNSLYYLEPELSIVLDINSKQMDLRASIINLNPVDSACEEKDYFEILGTDIALKRGDLFLSFINSNFETLDGFLNFATLRGLNGLLKYATNPSEISQFLENKKLVKNHIPKKTMDTFIESVFQNHRDTFINAKSLFQETLWRFIELKSQKENNGKSSLEIYFDNRLSELQKPLSKYSGKVRLEYETSIQYKLKESEEKVINKVFFSTDILALVYHDFFGNLENSSFNVCKSCNIIFAPRSRVDEVYCDSCKSLAYEERIKDNPVIAAYNAAYKARHKERQRNIKAIKSGNGSETDIRIWEQAFNSWIDYAKSKQQEVQENKITIEEYKKSLKVRLEDILNGTHRKAW